MRDPRSRHLFRIDDGDIELDGLKIGAGVDAPTVSASMATALLAYSGIAVKMLVDQRLDAQLHTMFMVEYEPGGVAHPHDHPLEESYYILEGEVEAHGRRREYTLEPGDLFWTGVGCVHAFYNRTGRTRALARDAVAAAAGAALLPIQPRLGIPADAHRGQIASSQPPKRRSHMADANDVQQALEGKQFWHLATVNPDGTPQNTVVWVQARDGKILVNTALGRKKPRNLDANPHVALSWIDPENPYRTLAVQGKVVERYVGDQAEADIDSAAQKYLGEDTYPWRKEGEQRVSYLIEPTHISGQ